jgi:hypothetical protein
LVGAKGKTPKPFPSGQLSKVLLMFLTLMVEMNYPDVFVLGDLSAIWAL